MKKRQQKVGEGAVLGTLAAAIAAALGSAARLHAQEPGAEEILVTGSRIVRRDFEANSPIMTIDATSFEESSTIAIESVLNKMPQFVPAAATQSGGANFIDLAVLGLTFAAITLVWLVFYSYLLATAGNFMQRPKVRRILEAVTGTILVALGLRLATEPR